eukprot:52557-Eustigmatos_ZCMA.PRE.1
MQLALIYVRSKHFKPQSVMYIAPPATCNTGEWSTPHSMHVCLPVAWIVAATNYATRPDMSAPGGPQAALLGGPRSVSLSEVLMMISTVKGAGLVGEPEPPHGPTGLESRLLDATGSGQCWPLNMSMNGA